MQYRFDVGLVPKLPRPLLPFTVILAVLQASFTETVGAADGFYVSGGLGYASIDGAGSIDRQSAQLRPTSVSFSSESLPINDTDFDWFALAGYRFNQYVGIEAGYFDLGSYRAESNIQVRPPDLAELDIEQLYIGARFRVPVYEKLSATWSIGVSRAMFSARGALPVDGVSLIGPSIEPLPLPPATPPEPPPRVIAIQPIPFSDPGDETGFVFGFGLEYALTRKMSLGLDYRRHDVQVHKVETFDLSVLLNL